MIRIKICGMRDADNIRKIAALSPDYMGFIFYPGSKRYVGSDFSLDSDIPQTIRRIGVFVNENSRNILEIARKLRLNIIQLHGNESPEDCSVLKSEGLDVIRAFGIDESFDFAVLDDFSQVCDYFLFDTKSADYGGSGEKFNIRLIAAYQLTIPFFISGGIGPGDSGYIKQINHEKLFAADINSRFEISPGIKDIKLVEQFIHEMRQPSHP